MAKYMHFLLSSYYDLICVLSTSDHVSCGHTISYGLSVCQILHIFVSGELQVLKVGQYDILVR